MADQGSVANPVSACGEGKSSGFEVGYPSCDMGGERYLKRRSRTNEVVWKTSEETKNHCAGRCSDMKNLVQAQRIERRLDGDENSGTRLADWYQKGRARQER